MDRRFIAAGLAVCCLLFASTAAADDSWVSPASNLTDPVGSTGTPQIASNARGDVVVAWLDTGSNKVFATDRPAGGSFGPAAAISAQSAQTLGSVGIDNAGQSYVFYGTDTGTASASRPRVATRQVGSSGWTVTPLAAASSADPPLAAVGAVAPSGRAIAVWFQGHTAGNEFSKLEFATKPAGSNTWSSKLDVTGACGCGVASATPQTFTVAINDTGDAALLFTRWNGGFVDQILMGETVPAGSTTWTTPSQISANGGSIQNAPVVAIDSTGTATAAWTRSNTQNAIVQFSTKTLAASSWAQAPAGTTITPGGNDLSALGLDAGQPAIAVGPDGQTTIAWARNQVAQERTRAAGGSSFSAATTLPDSVTNASSPTLAVNSSGEFAALWQGVASGHNAIAAARRMPGSATFTQIASPPGTDNGQQTVAIDDEGNIPAAWVTGTGPYTVEASAFDAAAPTISGVVFPDSPVAGQEFSYGAAAADRWSTVTASWAFGDGITGPLSGTHTYTTQGSVLAALTATDAFGHSVSTSKTVQVVPPPPAPTPPAGGGGTETPGPAAAPAITGLKLTPAKFKPASKGGSIATATGSTVKYSISEQSTTTFTVQRSLPGVRKGKRCVAPPKRKGKAKTKSCKRFVKVGSFTHTDAAAGAVSLKFTGRLKSRKLVPGAYRLVAVGSNAKGKGKAVSASFKIVKR